MDAKHDANGLQSGHASPTSEQGKPLLVIQTERHLSQGQRLLIREAAEAMATRVGMEALILDGGLKAEVHRDFAPLIDAITAQTDAINQLAASNMALVDAILDQIDDGYGDSAGLSRNYLDGSTL